MPPFGPYAPAAAFIAGLVVIFAWIVALFVNTTAAAQLFPLATFSFGAILTGTAVTHGVIMQAASGTSTSTATNGTTSATTHTP